MIRIARPAPARRRPAPAVVPIEDGEAAASCGWFDSSHELSAGLLVCEHCSGAADAALAALPLAVWLDLELAGWRVGDPAAARAR